MSTGVTDTSSPKGSGFLQRMLNDAEVRDGKRAAPSGLWFNNNSPGQKVHPAVAKRLAWLEEQQAKTRGEESKPDGVLEDVVVEVKQEQSLLVPPPEEPPEVPDAPGIDHDAAYATICCRLENVMIYDLPDKVRKELERVCNEVREVRKFC